MKRSIFYLLFLLCVVSGQAQQGYSFHSQNYLGLLQGRELSAFQLQTINGLQKKGWFAGLGLGIDYYRVRSIPAFFSVSKFLFEKQAVFITGNAGINFLWQKNEFIGNRTSVNYPPKAFYEAGLGWKIAIGKNDRGVLLHAGYSYKQIREKAEAGTFCPGRGSCPLQYEVYDHRYRRWMFKIGYLL